MLNLIHAFDAGDRQALLQGTGPVTGALLSLARGNPAEIRRLSRGGERLDDGLEAWIASAARPSKSNIDLMTVAELPIADGPSYRVRWDMERAYARGEGEAWLRLRAELDPESAGSLIAEARGWRRFDRDRAWTLLLGAREAYPEHWTVLQMLIGEAYYAHSKGLASRSELTNVVELAEGALTTDPLDFRLANAALHLDQRLGEFGKIVRSSRRLLGLRLRWMA